MAGRVHKPLLGAALAALVLSACVPFEGPARPVSPRPPATVPNLPVPEPSASSLALRRYYGNLQADLLAQGLLRTDGGGPDTPYAAHTLLSNFETIAFFDEYESGSWVPRAGNTPGTLRRWGGPVRMAVDFGPSVGAEQRQLDSTNIRLFAQRLNRVTGHPIAMSPGNANFHVMIVGEDDHPYLMSRLRQLVPNLTGASETILNNMPRSTHCLMLGYPSAINPSDIRNAIVVIRAEHPDILRKSCIHEELSQGLGLVNDSPHARPSIFNDDDEFALLTRHDEELLAVLYDRRLRIGMTLEQARPILRRIVAERMGGDS